MVELGHLGTLVNSFGQQVERCKTHVDLKHCQQTQTEDSPKVRLDDKAVQAEEQVKQKRPSKRNNRFLINSQNPI